MERKIGIVTDTNACLDYFDHHYDIPILRSMIHLGDEEFLDHIELTADSFYARIESDKSLVPKTSQPPTAIMIETYEAMKKKGYTDLIVITISKHMSGIYGAAQIAAQSVDGLSVHVVNSNSVAFPQAKMVLTAASMAASGKTVDQILKSIEFIRDNNHIYFAVDTLTYLVKNGRLSNAQGFLGSMLKIKPLLHISKEGKVESVEKIRTFSKAVDRVIEMFLEETNGLNIEPFICHANNEKVRDYITSKIQEVRPEFTEIFSMPLTPAVGAHAGPKAIGLGYYLKD
ncbi:DegV family protein [Liberiplasma polymorphum]|uniref:DegV family protein n=1 Tax=Liberiplasma polymorphum TaxID=3374570 RepID=UPI0037732CB9